MEHKGDLNLTSRTSRSFPVWKAWGKSLLQNQHFVLTMVLFILVAIMAVLTSGITIRPTNLNSILFQSSIRGIVAVGMTFVILTGGIDLSVGGMAVMVACIGGMMVSTDDYLGLGLPLVQGGILMLCMGAFTGALNGLAVSRLRVPPLIVTLAMWQVTYGIAYQVTHYGATITGFPENLAFLGQGQVVGIPVPVIIFLLIALFGYFLQNFTSFGRAVFAVGSNEKSAALAGINTKNIKLWVYVISGICAAIGGLITISRVMRAQVVMLGGLELDAIAAVVMGGVSLSGGKGSVIGAVLGAIIIGVINNGLNIIGVSPAVFNAVKGAVILTAVIADTLRHRDNNA